jgi:hypothetical protein
VYKEGFRVPLKTNNKNFVNLKCTMLKTSVRSRVKILKELLRLRYQKKSNLELD